MNNAFLSADIRGRRYKRALMILVGEPLVRFYRPFYVPLSQLWLDKMKSTWFSVPLMEKLLQHDLVRLDRRARAVDGHTGHWAAGGFGGHRLVFANLTERGRETAAKVLAAQAEWYVKNGKADAHPVKDPARGRVVSTDRRQRRRPDPLFARLCDDAGADYQLVSCRSLSGTEG